MLHPHADRLVMFATTFNNYKQRETRERERERETEKRVLAYIPSTNCVFGTGGRYIKLTQATEKRGTFRTFKLLWGGRRCVWFLVLVLICFCFFTHEERSVDEKTV